MKRTAKKDASVVALSIDDKETGLTLLVEPFAPPYSPYLTREIESKRHQKRIFISLSGKYFQTQQVLGIVLTGTDMMASPLMDAFARAPTKANYEAAAQAGRPKSLGTTVKRTLEETMKDDVPWLLLHLLVLAAYKKNPETDFGDGVDAIAVKDCNSKFLLQLLVASEKHEAYELSAHAADAFQGALARGKWDMDRLRGKSKLWDVFHDERRVPFPTSGIAAGAGGGVDVSLSVAAHVARPKNNSATDNNNGAATPFDTGVGAGAGAPIPQLRGWRTDGEVDICSAESCQVRFIKLGTIATGIRHHCRACGNIFCSDHVQKTIDLLPPNAPKPPKKYSNRDQKGKEFKVCDDCFERRQGSMCDLTFEAFCSALKLERDSIVDEVCSEWREQRKLAQTTLASLCKVPTILFSANEYTMQENERNLLHRNRSELLGCSAFVVALLRAGPSSSAERWYSVWAHREGIPVRHDTLAIAALKNREVPVAARLRIILESLQKMQVDWPIDVVPHVKVQELIDAWDGVDVVQSAIQTAKGRNSINGPDDDDDELTAEFPGKYRKLENRHKFCPRLCAGRLAPVGDASVPSGNVVSLSALKGAGGIVGTLAALAEAEEENNSDDGPPPSLETRSGSTRPSSIMLDNFTNEMAVDSLLCQMAFRVIMAAAEGCPITARAQRMACVAFTSADPVELECYTPGLVAAACRAGVEGDVVVRSMISSLAKGRSGIATSVFTSYANTLFYALGVEADARVGLAAKYPNTPEGTAEAAGYLHASRRLHYWRQELMLHLAKTWPQMLKDVEDGQRWLRDLDARCYGLVNRKKDEEPLSQGKAVREIVTPLNSSIPIRDRIVKTQQFSSATKPLGIHFERAPSRDDSAGSGQAATAAAAAAAAAVAAAAPGATTSTEAASDSAGPTEPTEATRFKILIKRDDMRSDQLVESCIRLSLRLMQVEWRCMQTMNIPKDQLFKVSADLLLETYQRTQTHPLKDYRVLPVSPREGICELIEARPFDDMKLGQGVAYPAEGPLVSLFVTHQNKKHDSFTEDLRLNYLRSFAFYSVMTYILGVKDRHLANLMVTDDAEVVHIDFGWIMDSKPVWQSGLESTAPRTADLRNVYPRKSEKQEKFDQELETMLKAIFISMRQQACIFSDLCLYVKHTENFGRGGGTLAELETAKRMGRLCNFVFALNLGDLEAQEKFAKMCRDHSRWVLDAFHEAPTKIAEANDKVQKVAGGIYNGMATALGGWWGGGGGDGLSSAAQRTFSGSSDSDVTTTSLDSGQSSAPNSGAGGANAL